MARKGIKKQGTIIDTHVHVGQFYDTYYDPVETISVALGTVDGVCFSSTTSCIDNVDYRAVSKEIESVTSMFDANIAKPYLWFCSHYRTQGLSVEKLMSELPYVGLKIHPRANNWDFSKTENIDIAHEVFSYAHSKGLSILVHTGYDLLDEANKFSAFFKEYTNAKIVLAHCRPLDQTLALLKLFSHVFCDTAFVDIETQNKIVEAGYKDRMLFGSDFPVTHYFATINGKKITLEEQYAIDVQNVVL